MTSPDLIALLVVAAVFVVSGAPFVVLAWLHLRQLQQGREERERLLLRSVQFLLPLRVPAPVAVAAPVMLSRFVRRASL